LVTGSPFATEVAPAMADCWGYSNREAAKSSLWQIRGAAGIGWYKIRLCPTREQSLVAITIRAV